MHCSCCNQLSASLKQELQGVALFTAACMPASAHHSTAQQRVPCMREAQQPQHQLHLEGAPAEAQHFGKLVLRKLLQAIHRGMCIAR